MIPRLLSLFDAHLPRLCRVGRSVAGFSAWGGVWFAVFGEGVCATVVGLFFAVLGAWLWGEGFEE